MVVLRYRRATGDRRQQLRWLALAAAVSVAVTRRWRSSVPLSDSSSRPLAFVAGGRRLPAAIAVAMLRYRLYDIDLVVNRLVLYGSLIAVITAVYVGVTVAGRRESPGPSPARRSRSAPPSPSP